MLDNPAPSPFLPDSIIQYAWDSTSLGWLMECDRKYFYAMIEGWRSKSESVHLKFGQLYHSALEMYDKARAVGTSHDDAQRDAVLWTLLETWSYETNAPWDSDHKTKNRETLVRSIIWYTEQFKDDPAKTYVLPDGKPAVELSFRFQLTETFEGQPYMLCGHMDRIVVWNDDLWATDRKTATGALSQDYFDGYKPDIQMSLYTIAARVVFSIPAKGVMIDAMQIGVGFSRPDRGVTYRTPEELDEDLRELGYWFERARRNVANNDWPKNPKSCHKFGGCAYRSVCSKSPSVRKHFLESNFVKHVWNPLEPR